MQGLVVHEGHAVTYGGRPLDSHVDDAPGRELCHNVLEFGGLWLVVLPDGTPVG